MQEALYSLLQMAKTSAALASASRGAAAVHFGDDRSDHRRRIGQSRDAGRHQHRRAAALIGFAGPRVIQQTVRETLPEGFQRSEFLLEHGALDMIVDRREMRERIGSMLRQLMGKRPRAARFRMLPQVSNNGWPCNAAASTRD